MPTDTIKIKLYPNQKVVRIHKTKSDKNNLYAIVNVKALMKALNELSKNEMKLYLYMLTNANEYTFAYSPEDVLQKTGASKRDLQRCFHNMIEKKYFIQSEDDKNFYHFYENPDDFYKNNDSDTENENKYSDFKQQCKENMDKTSSVSQYEVTIECGNYVQDEYGQDYHRNIISRKTKENKYNTQDFESNSSSETENISYATKKKVIEMFKNRCKYDEIKALTALSKSKIHSIITEYKKHGRILDLSLFGDDKKILDANGNKTNYAYGDFQIPPENAQIDFSDGSLFNMLTDSDGDYRFDKNLVAKWFIYLQNQ